MAMKVPQSQTRVPIETARIQAPRKPRISMPRAVPGAFGADVARATQALGEVGLKIAGHLQQMAQDDQDREVLRRETEYRQDLQNRLSNIEEETVQINGQDVTRPKGFLMRQLGNAKGSTQGLDKVYQEEVRNQYLKGLSRYQIDKLGPAMDGHYLSVRNSVITHEANQLDADFKNVTEANMKQKVLDASIIRNPKQLSAAIDDAIKSSSAYYRKFDPATRQILNAEIAKNMASSSIIATIERTGNYGMAKTMLDGIKSKIPDSVYNTINDEIAKRAVNIAIAGDMSVRQEDSAVMTELQKGKKGRFSFLSTSERIKAIKESQRRIYYNSQIDKREKEAIRDVRNDNIILKNMDGSLALQDIHRELLIPEEEGGLKKSILLRYQNALRNGIGRDLNAMLREKDVDRDPTARSKAVRKYNDLISLFIDEDTDKWVAKEKLAEAYADGIINAEESKFLNDLKNNLKDIEFNRSASIMNGIIKGVKSLLNQYNATDEEIAIELKQLLGTLAVSKPTDSTLAQERTNTHVLNKVPDAPNFPEEGQSMMDVFGDLITIFPDGRTKPYIEQQKTTETKSKPKTKPKKEVK